MTGINSLIFVGVFIGALSPTSCLQEESRDARFSIFQIIKFQNAPCIGGTRNGTCFTSAECENAGGTEDGTCADGFGVCCVTIISNGMATSLNQSYIVESAPISGTYMICPCSRDICRIRFDFTMFTLAAPVSSAGTTQGTAVAAANVAGVAANSGQSIGDCQADQFSITSSAGSGTPIICGVNTGQHVIVDSDGAGCTTLNLGIGATTGTRNLDIMVTQFKCGEEMGGPPGCLQWFTQPTGSVRSFNFPNQAPGTAVAATVMHLSNQKYTSCIRQPLATTIICYIPCTVVARVEVANMPATAQTSFGTSISPNAAANTNEGTSCTSDYVTIPGGDVIANILGANLGQTVINTRFCGRGLATTIGGAGAAAIVAINASICTTAVPFEIGVNFDEDEISGGIGTAIVHEAEAAPGGILGFCLSYTTT